MWQAIRLWFLERYQCWHERRDPHCTCNTCIERFDKQTEPD